MAENSTPASLRHKPRAPVDCTGGQDLAAEIDPVEDNNILQGLKASLILDCECTLGEGAVWDSQLNVLFFCDIMKGIIYRFDPYNDAGSEEKKKQPGSCDSIADMFRLKEIDITQFVGTVVPVESSDPANKQVVLAAIHRGFVLVDVQSGQVTKFLGNPEEKVWNNRYNDGKCDPRGRFWVGSMDLQLQSGKGALYCVDPFLKTTVQKLSGCGVPNGIAWSLDERKMYWVDSNDNCVFQFDYDVDSGEISNQRTILVCPPDTGIFDGMTIDSKGMLWIAHWDGFRVAQYHPLKGKCLRYYTLPVGKVTSCAFGGHRLDKLYITTASYGNKEKKHAGGVYCIDFKNTSVKGIESYRYALDPSTVM
eukprot:Nk52_evm5s2596 gene=Nk52_evmTU5s2596